MKKANNSYFSHDSNARNDELIIKLRLKHGAKGYGIYFMILERMREDTDYFCTADYSVLAFDFREEAEIIKDIVENFDLFEFTEDGTAFYSISFLKRMALKDKQTELRKERAKKGAEARWSSNAKASDKQSKSNAKAMLKHSKSTAEAEPEDKPKIDYKVIVDYLNEKTGKSFRASSKKTKDLINARVNEGYKLEDFKKVIDNKTTQWLDSEKMKGFLRPETLFSNKFEGYLNEEPAQPRFKGNSTKQIEEVEEVEIFDTIDLLEMMKKGDEK